MPAITSEAQFETEIVAHLVRHSGWLEGHDSGYDAHLALFCEDAVFWVKETQPESWGKFCFNHPRDADAVFCKRLAEELDRKGTLQVLRKGFKDINATFRMAQFAPANGLNEKTLADYDRNRLRVVRQVYYSEHNRRSIDLVFFVNGIPVATSELKTDTTQPVQNAIHQYRVDRPPVDTRTKAKEPLLQFGKRALVHFAVSCDEVWMTTHLQGPKTFFLPFNRGTEDGGAGNPSNPHGYATSYLWEDVLRKDVWMLLLGKYLHVERSEKEDPVTGKKATREILLFPRFHQFDAVRKILAATRAEGAGGNFLVQHSAGSGKSNTIGWLAYQLASLHDDLDQKIFDSVIVVTDRRVLDSQLQDTIYQLDHQHGVVQKIDENSRQLADALNSAKPIIITTIQKFPYILRQVSELGERRFAIIIDEAHSSQSGKTAHSLRRALSSGVLVNGEETDSAEENGGEDEISGEDVVATLVASRKRPPNASYYAFTATPKPKTIELFGRPPRADLPASDDNKPEAFHVYSMRQAIEEKFILDVLTNYVTYSVFWKLSQVGEDREVEAGKASKVIARYAKLHPTNITQKVAIIIEHFREKVMHKIGGRAKAMVVTDSRLAAVRYKLALDKYLKAQGYTDCKALVAYSGTITDAESGVDKAGEGDLNERHQRDDRIQADFATDEYRVLLVANKFQTGFDQPLLHSMYVDKRLAGVLAVQTLSRLNRTCPGKEETFVLDFVNKSQDILEAFTPYYRTATLSGVSDPNIPHRLKDKLDAVGVYLPAEVETFVRALMARNGSQAVLQAQLKPAADRYRVLAPEAQELFRTDLSTFLRAYEFLSQIIPYEDPGLETLYWYAKALLPRLQPQVESDDLRLEDSLTLTHLRIQKRGEMAIRLEGTEAEPLEPMTDAGSGAGHENVKAPLSLIVSKLNDLFSGDLSDADLIGYATHLIGKMSENEELREQARANDTVGQFAKGDYRKTLKDSVIDAMQSHQQMAEQALKQVDTFNGLAELLVDAVYRRLRGERPDVGI
ncbi:type I restriction endonuclease subunit R [Thiomonas sp.]